MGEEKVSAGSVRTSDGVSLVLHSLSIHGVHVAI
jgi:hypothetical protein